MGAAEDDRIDLLVLCQESLQMLAHEEVGPWAIALARLHNRYPQRASLLHDRHVGVELVYLSHIALTRDGTLSSEDAHMLGTCERIDALDRRADDPQHTTTHRASIELRQILLLYLSERLRRGGVASEDDQRTA